MQPPVHQRKKKDDDLMIVVIRMIRVALLKKKSTTQNQKSSQKNQRKKQKEPQRAESTNKYQTETKVDWIYSYISLMYFSVFLVSVVILVRNKCILWLALLCRLDVWVVRDRPAGLQWKSSKQTHSCSLSNTCWYILWYIS